MAEDSAVVSKSVLTSKTQWVNALAVLLPLLGAKFGWLTPEVLDALATLFGCAQEELPKLYVAGLAGVNMLLRQITTTPLHLKKPK